MQPIYSLMLLLASPFWVIGLLLTGRAKLLGRFRPTVPAQVGRPIWVHACSVGEVNVAIPLMQAARDRWPEIPMLLTVSTLTGREEAGKALPDGCCVTWFPFDLRGSVRGFLARSNPRALILVETELWPNVLTETAARGVPIALVNGRLSEGHIDRYRAMFRAFSHALNGLRIAVMQSEEYGARAAEIGLAPGIVAYADNLKLDVAPPRVSTDERRALREWLGIQGDAQVVVFGSTRPGDEKIARMCWEALQETHPNLVLILGVRHPDRRIADALTPFADVPVLKWSELERGDVRARGERVIYLDTLGKLNHCYALAAIAVIGGSFDPSVQGHNPLEPGAQGVPVVFGPHMDNFKSDASLLTDGGGAVQVGDAEEVSAVLAELLADSERRESTGARALAAIEGRRGPIKETLDLIAGPLGLS